MSRGKMTASGFCWDGKVVAPYHFVLHNYYQVCDVNGENSKHYYMLSAEIGQKNFTEPITISNFANLVGSAHWEQCVDADLSSKSKKILIADLQEQLAGWREPICVVEFDEPGLYSIDGKYVYCTSDGTIIQGLDDQSKYRYKKCIQLPERDESTSQEKMPDYLAKLLRFYPGVTDMLVLYVALAHMKPIFALLGIPVDVILAITGNSGSFKTTLAKVVVPESAQFKFLTVKASQLEKQLLLHTGSCVLVDDYKNAKQKHVRDRLTDIFDVLSRIADSSKNAMAITTGEFLEGDFSFQDRLYQVFTQKSRGQYAPQELAILSFLSENRKVFQAFIRDFEQRIYRNVSGMIDIIEERRGYLREQNSGFRIDWNIGLLKIVLDVLCQIYPDSVFSNQKKRISQSLETVYKNQVKRMEKIYMLETDADWTWIFYQAFDRNAFCTEIEGLSHPQRIVDNGYIYVTRASLVLGIKSYIQGECDPKVVIRDLDDKQMLAKDNSKDYTVKHKNGGRYYCVNLERLMHYAKTKKMSR